MVTSRRTLETPAGPISYTLVRKAVKRVSLRIGRGGEVILTIPIGHPIAPAEDFLRAKSGWVLTHLARMEQNRELELPPEPPREVCVGLLQQALDRVCPLVQPLGVAVPMLKVRKMRSQWGNCHWTQGYITLNAALARCPEDLRDYVALHELIHFLHHDHGAGFYARMDALMPDWRERRARLKGYSGALAPDKDETGKV